MTAAHARIAFRPVSSIGCPLWFTLPIAAVVAVCTVVIVMWTASDGGDEGVEGVANTLVARVNGVRAQQGLAPLQVSDELARASEAYAKQLTVGGRFSHTGADGSTLDKRAENAGYAAWELLAENLAMGKGAADADVILAGWMRSPGHRQNVLAAVLTEIGISCAFGSGAGSTAYWCVATFAAPQR